MTAKEFIIGPERLSVRETLAFRFRFYAVLAVAVFVVMFQ